MTQTAAVLAYMQQHGSITALEAERELNCHRVAARIHDLKEAGIAIAETRVTSPSGSRFSRYSLQERRGGVPIGKARQCPACHQWHSVGVTCQWTA